MEIVRNVLFSVVKIIGNGRNGGIRGYNSENLSKNTTTDEKTSSSMIGCEQLCSIPVLFAAPLKTHPNSIKIAAFGHQSPFLSRTDAGELTQFVP